jgi:hypothetical protein
LPTGKEAAGIIKYVIQRIRHNWPRIEIMLRRDDHYGTPEVMELLEDKGCSYYFSLPGNARLKKNSQPWCEDVAVRQVQQDKDKLRRFYQVCYQAESWSRVTQGHRPCRSDLEGLRYPLRRHQPARHGQGTLREDLLRSWPNRKHDQGSQDLHQIRPHFLPSLGSQSVPALPAYQSILVIASAPLGCAALLDIPPGDV